MYCGETKSPMHAQLHPATTLDDLKAGCSSFRVLRERGITFRRPIYQLTRLERSWSGSAPFLLRQSSHTFLDVPIRPLTDHLIPISLVAYDLLNGTTVIFCFRCWGLEIHSFPNRLRHDLCLMRLGFSWRVSQAHTWAQYKCQ